MKYIIPLFLFILSSVSTSFSQIGGGPSLPQTPNEVTKGKVVYVTDGDTFHMLINGEKTKIRLADIDAPETTQPFGLESKEYLMTLIKGKEVKVEIRNTDRYGREVAFVHVDDTDINLKMIQSGFAWWYEKYGPNNTTYKAAQEKAKKEKVGLWSKKDAIEPWAWRKRE